LFSPQLNCGENGIRKQERLAEKIYGARNQAEIRAIQKKSRKQCVFSGLNWNQTRASLHPSFIQTITVGSGVAPDHAFASNSTPALAGGARELSDSISSWAVPPIGNSPAHDFEMLRHFKIVRVSPCPEGFYLVVKIIPCRAQIA
jgi:hypothetical protein